MVTLNHFVLILFHLDSVKTAALVSLTYKSGLRRMGLISSIFDRIGNLMVSCPVEPQPAKLLPCSSQDIFFAKQVDPLDEPVITFRQGSPTLLAIQAASHQLAVLKTPVAIPTETVYGLAADALNGQAVAQIFSTKGRPADNPLIVHVSSRPMLLSLLPPSYTIPPSYERLMAAFWPGPLTLLFPADPSKIPSIVTAGHPTVAIRMPSHPVARALISHSQTPLAAPSANSSGRPSPTRAEHVWNDIGHNGKVPIILDGGPCDVGLESTVVDGLGEDGTVKVLRPGGVTVEKIEEALQQDLVSGERTPRVLVHRRDYEDHEMEQNPVTPGMKYLHYTPSVPVILLLPENVDQQTKAETLAELVDDLLQQHFSATSTSMSSPHVHKIGALFSSGSVLTPHLKALENVQLASFDLGPLDDPSVAARRLFDGLLTLEKEGVEIILVEGVSEENEGLAVMNRLRKAAEQVRWVKMR